jgi:phospholipid/cholesterol/gamma-HCH transport system permease protein
MPEEKHILSIKETTSEPSSMSFDRTEGGTLLINLVGNWKLGEAQPSVDDIQWERITVSKIKKVAFNSEKLKEWDSSLLTFLIKLTDQCQKSGIAVANEGLPEGVKSLLKLASAVPERKGARKAAAREPFLARVGGSSIGLWQSAKDLLSFIGEAFLAFLKFLVGRASFRRRDLGLFLQQCGANALPIVSLISFLVGLILAFVGAVQLAMFGAQIYVADLVGIAMLRVMGAIMAGIVMAGRTGAAFAAQLGTMQVNEEIDALKTMGVSPMEFLVLPRMLALVVMMPLLCIYADLMGILGGLIVGVGMLDIGLIQYLNQTKRALSLNHLFIGVFQAGVFGVLVALAGCLRGIQCGRSASAVGDATTSAVVTSIVAIIIATALVTVGCNVLGI